MIALLLGAALVVIVALLVASARIVDERDQWMTYAWRLQDELEARSEGGVR